MLQTLHTGGQPDLGVNDFTIAAEDVVLRVLRVNGGAIGVFGAGGGVLGGRGPAWAGCGGGTLHGFLGDICRGGRFCGLGARGWGMRARGLGYAWGALRYGRR